jgi:hypothetical protein
MEFTDTSTKINSWSKVITIQAKSPVWRDEAKRKAMFKVLIKLDYFGVVSSEDYIRTFNGKSKFPFQNLVNSYKFWNPDIEENLPEISNLVHSIPVWEFVLGK